MKTAEFRVRVKSRPAADYPVLVGAELLLELPRLVAETARLAKDCPPGRFESVAVIHDRAVTGVAERVVSVMPGAVLVPVASGEQSKTVGELERVVSVLLERGLNRQSLIVAVGGGMTTDLGGFVAGVYMRGIPHINVPTTVLAMVDAAVGGKTALDLPTAKNIIGLFHHPRAVVADITVLDSLPEREFRDGLVEAVKTAAILDRAVFEWFEQELEQVLARDRRAVAECVESAVRLKAGVVADDERDQGRRMLLNFGHTVGHALETLSGYRLSHGEAVALGMVIEMRFAGGTGVDRLTNLLERTGVLPVARERAAGLFAELRPEAFEQAVHRDKKTAGGRVRMAAPVEIGLGKVLPFPERGAAAAVAAVSGGWSKTSSTSRPEGGAE